ncbi:MAG: hypothetical protein C5B43_00570, partial [Verrucomicrobia bacterium]
EILLKAGADPKARDSKSLILASQNGYKEIVEILINAGADPKAQDSWALRQASQEGHTEIVVFLLEQGADPRALNSKSLIVASEKGQKEIVEILLKVGADPKAADSHALRQASQEGHQEIVSILLKSGADPKAKGSLALVVASEKGQKEIIKILLAAGADPKAQDSWALRRAIQKGHKEIVEMLLEAGADPKALDSLALRLAIQEGYKEIVKILLEAGADPKSKDSMALALASEKGDLAIVEMLLEAGADLKAQNALAYRLAEQKKHQKILQLFRKVESRAYLESFIFNLDKNIQIALLNELFQREGKDAILHYFVDLKKENIRKAIDFLSETDNKDLRLLILESISVRTFAEFFNILLDTKGEAVVHWGYGPKGDFKEKLYISPNARAQQFVNFFMHYKTFLEKPFNQNECRDEFQRITFEEEEILKLRGQKIAKVFNKMNQKQVIDLLYGRPDIRIFDKMKAKISQNKENPIDREITFNSIDYYFYYNKETINGQEQWVSKDKNAYEKDTLPCRVEVKSINYIVPYLSEDLIVEIFNKEAGGDKGALVELINILSCEKAMNKLYKILGSKAKEEILMSCDQPVISSVSQGFTRKRLAFS